MSPGSDAVILFAHGARDPRWAEPFQQVAALMRQRQPTLAVRLAFLEFMAPTLPEAGAELALAGCRHIAVLPMFLGVGGHVRKDLPALLQALREAHPGVELSLLPAIGEQPDVMQAMADSALRQIGTAAL